MSDENEPEREQDYTYVIHRFPTGMLDEDARDVKIIVIDVGQPPRYSTMKSNNWIIMELMSSLLKLQLPDDDNLIVMHSGEAEPGLAYNCIVRGVPAYGPIQVMKRDEYRLVDVLDSDMEKVTSYLTDRQ